MLFYLACSLLAVIRQVCADVTQFKEAIKEKSFKQALTNLSSLSLQDKKDALESISEGDLVKFYQSLSKDPTSQKDAYAIYDAVIDTRSTKTIQPLLFYLASEEYTPYFEQDRPALKSLEAWQWLLGSVFDFAEVEYVEDELRAVVNAALPVHLENIKKVQAGNPAIAKFLTRQIARLENGGAKTDAAEDEDDKNSYSFLNSEEEHDWDDFTSFDDHEYL